MGTTKLHVCITCKTCKGSAPATQGEGPRPGALLFEAVQELGAPEGVSIVPVECLSACSQGCSVALSGGEAKWSYVYGRLGAEDASEILRGAELYAASENGVVPWRERPEIFRKQSLARLPPPAAPSDPPEKSG